MSIYAILTLISTRFCCNNILVSTGIKCRPEKYAPVGFVSRFVFLIFFRCTATHFHKY